MFRKTKIIWWERSPVGTDAAGARLRGAHEGGGAARAPAAPYYGPVTVLMDSEAVVDLPGFAH